MKFCDRHHKNEMTATFCSFTAYEKASTLLFKFHLETWKHGNDFLSLTLSLSSFLQLTPSLSLSLSFAFPLLCVSLLLFSVWRDSTRQLIWKSKKPWKIQRQHRFSFSSSFETFFHSKLFQFSKQFSTQCLKTFLWMSVSLSLSPLSRFHSKNANHVEKRTLNIQQHLKWFHSLLFFKLAEVSGISSNPSHKWLWRLGLESEFDLIVLT